jgi:hypothetical protein
MSTRARMLQLSLSLWFCRVLTSYRYTPGDAVFATFQGANPRNNLRTQDSFLRVEMSTNGGSQWNPVLLDGDWETKFHWAKGGLMESVITLEWDIPSWYVGVPFALSPLSSPMYT